MGIIIRTHGNQPLPTGVYRVKLIAVELADTYCGDRLKWVFSVVDDERTIVDYTTLSVSNAPVSKCVEWCNALLNRELQPDEELDLETLVGRTAIAYVRLKKRNGREYNRIEKLLPDYYIPFTEG
jgi:hypothetical protein